nr:HU family DNA-binding protein [Paraburkholderia aspalathi]
MSQMTPTFNMKNLSDAVADQFGLSHQDGANIIRFVFDKLRDELVAGKQVRLHQFGTLEARKRAAGEARNPATGERIKVPARRVIKLTVSPTLRQAVSH